MLHATIADVAYALVCFSRWIRDFEISRSRPLLLLCVTSSIFVNIRLQLLVRHCMSIVPACRQLSPWGFLSFEKCLEPRAIRSQTFLRSTQILSDLYNIIIMIVQCSDMPNPNAEKANALTTQLSMPTMKEAAQIPLHISAHHGLVENWVNQRVSVIAKICHRD
jgi:hypothetical protein